MDGLVIILGGVFGLLLLLFLVHLSAVVRLAKPKKRHEMGLDSCIDKRQKANKRNNLLGTLVIISAVAVLSYGYYGLFAEGINATGSKQVETKPKTKNKTMTSTNQSTSQSSSVEKESKEETKTIESTKLAKEQAEKEAAEAQKAEAKKQEDAKEQEEAKAVEESKQQAAEEAEGDGLPISLEGSFETNAEGVAAVTGKAKGGIKKLSVTNSLNDQEQVIDVSGDGTFSFDYTMTDPMATVILFVCDVSQVGSIAQEDRQQTSINANSDFMMAYQEQQNAKNEQEYE